MTLSFKTKIENKPTEFVSKIWASMPINHKSSDLFKQCINNDLIHFDSLLKPKIHTIRNDSKSRWRVGQNIHFVINNRTPKRFQFAPILPVKFIQAVDIFSENQKVYVGLNGTMNLLSKKGVETLAKNDGFDSVDAFFNYFNQDFSGKIIHWTDFVYA